MIAVDTNVLVRFLVADDPEQSAKASALLAAAERNEERVFLTTVVLAELAWVLATAYAATRKEIAGAFVSILEHPVFQIEQRPRVESAVERYRAGRADFADYLIGEGAASAGASRVFTFDRALRREAGFEVI